MQNTTMKIELNKFLQVTSPEELKRQNKILNELIVNPASIKQLLELMQSDEVLSLQQLMSILLRKSIGKSYLKLPEAERTQIKKVLLVDFIVSSDRFSENILRRLSEAIAAICVLENTKLAQWPELQQTISQGLGYTDQAQTLKALCLLDSIYETDHDYFNFEECVAIYERLVLVFGNPYNPQLNKLYLLTLKLMAMMGLEIIESEKAGAEKENELIKSLLMSIHTLGGFPGFLNDNLLDAEKTLNFIFEGMFLSLTHFPHKWENNREMLLEFVLSDGMLVNPVFGIGVKSAIADVLAISLRQFKEYFAKDKKDTSLFQKIFKKFYDIIVPEEKALSAKLAQNSEDFDEYTYSKEQRHANYIFNVIKIIAGEYSYKSMYSLVQELFKSLNEFPRLQLHLLISINEGLYAHISREFDLYFGFAFGKLNSGSYSEKVLALRSLSFFLENNTLKVMDYFSKLMNSLILTLSHLSASALDEKAIYIFDEIMIVLELLVENGEPEHVEPFGFNLLQILTNYIQNKSLNLNVRKLALRVVSALLTSLSQKQIQEIHVGLMAVLAQSCLEDYLVSETLIAIGRLSFYHLKDHPDEAAKISIFEQTYVPFVKKAVEISSQPKKITDHELLEGAYSSVYFAVMTLKRHAIKIVPPKLILLTVEYMESRAFVEEMEVPESEDEDKDEKKDDLEAYLSSLSVKSMLVAGHHLIGHSMQIFPDEVLKASIDPATTITRIKELLMQQELDDNQDLRCQSFKAFAQMTIGLAEFCNTDLTGEFLGLLQDFCVSEDSNIVINRFFVIVNEWLIDLQKLVSHNKVNSQVLFSSNTLKQISNCIICIIRKQEESLDPDVLSIICQVNETICSPLIAADFDSKVKSKYGSIKVFPRLSSRYITFPPEILALIMEYLESLYKITFEPLINRLEEMDIMCIEELIGSLAELINKIGFPLITLGQRIFPETSLVDVIFGLSLLQDETLDRNIAFLLGVLYMHMPSNFFGDKLGQSVSLLSSFYQKYPSNAAIKDNCLSSMCKLYLNPAVASEVQSLITIDNLLLQIESSVPLEGDQQEANYVWKVLFKGCEVNKQKIEEKIINNLKMLTFLLKTLVYDKALIEDQIFDWLLNLAKNSAAQAAMQNITGSLDSISSTKLAQVLG